MFLYQTGTKISPKTGYENILKASFFNIYENFILQI